MHGWQVLSEILILLAGALTLGAIAERLRQSAIVGYLVAGMIVGPHVLGLVRGQESVELLAELGAAILLFTIGLEFSLKRLRRMGAVVFWSGILQVALTTLVCWGLLFGYSGKSSFSLVIAIMLAMSSTATIIRLLNDQAAMETPWGRGAVGILLLQDAMLLPATIVVTAAAQGTQGSQLLLTVGKTLLFMLALLAGFYAVLNWIAPRLLSLKQWAANRELPIILAMVMATGSAYAAHSAGLSTAIGAFIAGVMLGASPFAVQIRADVAPLRAILVTVFFGSIGMLANPGWAGQQWAAVALSVAGVVVVKIAVVWLVLRLLKQPVGISLASAFCLANVGEFSFVMAQAARGKLLDEAAMNIIVSVSVISLIAAPYMVKLGPVVAGGLERFRRRGAAPQAVPGALPDAGDGPVIIVGFGPAGQRVAESLMTHHAHRLRVVELSVKGAAVAERYGLSAVIGSATQAEVLEQAGIGHAAIVVITLPDPDTSQQVINLCRSLNSNVHLLARARYHAYRWELQMAGADAVIDEEEQMGLRLAAEARRQLGGA